jgi:hypothetical protein
MAYNHSQTIRKHKPAQMAARNFISLMFIVAAPS